MQVLSFSASLKSFLNRDYTAKCASRAKRVGIVRGGWVVAGRVGIGKCGGNAQKGRLWGVQEPVGKLKQFNKLVNG